MRAQEAFTFATDTTSATAFTTSTGGLYGWDYVASVWGTATLQKLSQDGSTYVSVLTAVSANGSQLVQLPPGTYQILLSGTTGFKSCIARVPND